MFWFLHNFLSIWLFVFSWINHVLILIDKGWAQCVPVWHKHLLSTYYVLGIIPKIGDTKVPLSSEGDREVN